MKKWRYLLLIFLHSLFSCTSKAEQPVDVNSDSEEIPLAMADTGKPIIAIYPVVMDHEQSAALLLGEAYMTTLTELLESMQIYDLRILPEGFQRGKLNTYGFDHLILAEVSLNDGGTLELSAKVLDGHKEVELISINEKTQDYLALFPMAEKMVTSMVEEFYGSHLAFSTLSIESFIGRDYQVFIDKVPRWPNDQGLIPVLSGMHHVLIMGNRENQVYINKNINFQEGLTAQETLYESAFSYYQYLGNDLSFNIDGNPEEWMDTAPLLVDDPAVSDIAELDMLTTKLAFDGKKLYALSEFTAPFHYKDSGLSLVFQYGGQGSQTSVIVHSLNDQSLAMFFNPYGEWIEVKDNSPLGKVSRKGSLLEISADLEKARIEEERSMKLTAYLYRFSHEEGTFDDVVTLTEKILLTRDPTPILLWKNKDWAAGTSTAQSTYRVMSNLIAIDRNPNEWTNIPTIISDNSASSDSALLLLKAAVDENRFYWFLQSEGKWDRQIPLTIKLDCGDDQERTIRIEGRNALLQQEEKEWSLESEMKWGENYMEGSVLLDSLGSDLPYVNIMQVSQIGGNRLDLVPYF